MLFWLSAAAQAADFFEGFGFYLGDPHVHTGHSGDGASSDLDDCEGCGAFSDVMQLARDNDLDFVSLSEHVNGPPHATVEGFEAVVEATRTGNDPEGGFVTLMGAEVWFSINGTRIGHKNLYIFAEDEALDAMTLGDVQFDEARTDVADCAEIWSWMSEVEATWGSAVLVPHHPAMSGDMTTDWSCHSHDDAAHFSPVAEIYSRHGNSDWIDASYDPLWLGYAERGALGFAMDPQGLALRMGFFGGTDGHDTRPGAVCDQEVHMDQHPYGGGLTVAMIPEEEAFSRESLHAAVLSRRTYATSGPLLPAVVSYHSGGAYLGGMGEYVGLPDEQPLDIELRIPAELAVYVLGVDFVGPAARTALTDDGGGVYRLTLQASEVPAWGYPEVSLSGADWYGQGGCEDGGEDDEERVWLSPTWFDDSEADLDGDGVSFADGDCDDGNPDVHPGAAEDCAVPGDEDCDGAADADDDDCDIPDTGGDAERGTEPAGESAPDAVQLGVIEPVGGCSTAPAIPALSWGLLVLVRRRRM